jgi:hypothetical protein
MQEEKPMTIRTRSNLVSATWLATLFALGLIVLSAGCGGDPATNGGLCARCSAGDPPCSDFTLLSQDEAEVFCGDARQDQCNFCRRDVDDFDQDGLRDDIVCTVQLSCRQQLNSAKLRCYPLRPDKSLITEYICDDDKPRP